MDHAQLPTALPLRNYLEQFGYRVNLTWISDLLEDLLARMGEPWDPPTDKAALAHAKLDAGNRLREQSERND